MRFLLPIATLLAYTCTYGQSQVCPPNNDFSYGALTHWAAFIGFAQKQNGVAAQQTNYDSAQGAASTTYGVASINEYGLTDYNGITVINASSTDYLGGFQTVPNINGYQYSHSVLLGSTAISRNNSDEGGYTRGIKYRIKVPAGSVTVPYTMTYAYAMVLENGTHNSNQQPVFSATLTRQDGTVITCASPKYLLPTRDNADTRGSGATLDTATAVGQGFYLSAHPSPNPNPNSNDPNEYLRDVWAKGWTEVTFDLAPYRGQTVDLVFETDNCVPGGHFAYSYIAMRNICDGLQISGPKVACIAGTMTYSIPALTGASYTWTVPAGWVITSGKDSSVIQVIPSPNGGTITVREVNSCADLTASLDVTTTTPTIASYLQGNNEVCSGTNSTTMTIRGNNGSVLNWLASTDNGVSYTTLPVTDSTYTATNLTATTIFKVLVQNGSSCAIDTSTMALVLVDSQSVGGTIDPDSLLFCLGQNKDALLQLKGYVGSVVDWQSSPDGVSWTDFSPTYRSDSYNVVGMTSTSSYRVIVKSGVCPLDSSASAIVVLVNAQFPAASYAPADTSICYGATVPLNAVITAGTSYAWNNTGTLAGGGDGTVGALPYQIQATASPLNTTNYILSVLNAGCPNALKDTFHVYVYPQIVVDAGRDTSVVVNQPLQLHATASDGLSAGFGYSWTPTTDLDDPQSQHPIATLGSDIDSIRYTVKASTEAGCYGTASILVKVFKTDPEIFVPNAFTPGGSSNFVFRPIPVGIANFQYFRVYTRWGQLVYTTTQTGQGWDGRINGHMQPTGTYVWMAQGISYTGKTVFRKGTMVLVR